MNSQSNPSHSLEELRAEVEQLRRSVRQYRLLYDTMLQGAVFQAADGTIISMNPAAERILGKSREEFLGQTSASVEHHTIREDHSPFPASDHPSMVALHTGREIRDVVMGVFNPRQQQYRWINIHAVPLFNAGDSRPHQVYTVFDDITERKQAEDAVYEREAILRQVGHMAHLGGWELRIANPDDLNANPLTWSDEVFRIFGYEPGEVAVSNELFFSHIHPDDRQRIVEAVGDAIAERHAYAIEHRIIRRDGIERTLFEHAEIEFNRQGRPTRIIGAVQDITDRKRVEVALRKSEERYRGLIEQVKDYAIFTTDPGGIITSWNEGVLNVLGYSSGQFLGMDSRLLFTPEDCAAGVPEQELHQAAATGTAPDDRWMLKRGDRRFWAYGTTTALRDPDNVLIGFTKIMRDQTEQKQAEETLHKFNEELERRVRERTAQLDATIRELESFSYSVSHDLRAPLRAINAFTAIVLEEQAGRLEEEAVRHLRIIQQNARSMGQLIDELLVFTRLSRAELHIVPVPMTHLARAVFEELKKNEPPERTIRFQLHTVPDARGSEVLLRQVLVNLMTNALKFTRTRAETVIEVGAYAEGEQNIYFLRDNGVGFDMNYAGKMFGVFQRLHDQQEYEGTGIGLALVKRIIERHGGSVWAEGKIDAGATLYFSLPKELPRG